jgi:hypothetical protein
VELAFSMHGAQGTVEAFVGVNSDPETLGCRPAALGFPYCSATISHPARGYAAAVGWIQLVRATDDATGGTSFAVDPFEPLGPVSHPFCFFGFLPALFDAPSRDPLTDMEWIAHSFLCRLDDSEGAPAVIAILGFAWGFSVRQGQIASWGPEPLAAQEWDRHQPILTAEYPGWSFARQYHAG